MERLIRLVLYILIVLSVLAASSFFYAEEFYHKMVAEDSPFEYATAFVLLIVSVLFFVRILKVGKGKNKYWTVFSTLVVVGAFFGFGEELSWGQRIFNVESGEFFLEQNRQAETNLHNLEIKGVSINKLIFSQLMVLVFGFYFVFSQLLYRKTNFFRNLVNLFGVQIPAVKHTVLMLACTGFILLVPDLRIWELWEAIFVSLLLLVFVEPYNNEEKLIV